MVAFDFLTLDVSTDVQASVLSFVGQEAIAHAAAIFATLTAAFAFATVYATLKKEPEGKRATFCILILSILLTGGIYAALRLYYYGLLSAIVLYYHGEPNQTYSLTQYWGNVTYELVSGKAGHSSFFSSTLALVRRYQVPLFRMCSDAR